MLTNNGAIKCGYSFKINTTTNEEPKGYIRKWMQKVLSADKWNTVY